MKAETGRKKGMGGGSNVPGNIAAHKLKGGGGVARGAGRIVDVACVC